jgi:uncharacterized protein YebE (UPF0316 family)
MTAEAVLLAAAIFLLRILNYTISTIRLVTITRQQRLLSSILAFLEALIFAVVIAKVVTDLDNILNLMAYCLGAAVGSYVGIVLEARLITSYRTVNIVAQKLGHELAQALRDNDFGVTEALGEGLDGEVTMLRCVVVHREVPKLLQLTRKINPDAFIAIEEARIVRQGYVHVPGRPR